MSFRGHRLIRIDFLQYEKGKPLVNLVDNMVKLGSLYRAGAPSTAGQFVGGQQLREKLEFNHRIQEQRLLAEERKEWERISPDHHQLQVLITDNSVRIYGGQMSKSLRDSSFEFVLTKRLKVQSL